MKIYLEGKLDSFAFEEFEEKLNLAEDGEEVIIEFYSDGGSMDFLYKFKKLIKEKEKINKIKFIANIKRAGSTALLCALLIKVRKYTKESCAGVHLPEVKFGYTLPIETLLIAQENVIGIYTQYSKLTRKDIRKYNCKFLRYREMQIFGIGTELVEEFEYYPYCR